MKIINVTLLILLLGLTPASLGDDTVTVDNFKKMSLAEQAIALEKAPPELKSQLHKIYLHGYLMDRFGGEKGFERQKEYVRIGEKGLKDVMLFYSSKFNLWSQYIGSVVDANRRSGMSLEKQMEVAKKFKAKLDADEKMNQTVEQLLFKLQVSSDLQDLAKKAQTYLQQAPNDQATKEELENMDKEGDELYEVMKKLPALTAEEIQKEYDSVPDEKIHLNMDEIGPSH